MILAATVEHTVDVDGMLDRMHPEQFSEWVAFYFMTPWAVGFPVEIEKNEGKGDSLATFRAMAGV